MSNLPPGTTDRDCGAYEPERFDLCPECDCEVGDEVWCAACGAVLDAQEAAAEERFAHEAEGWDREQER